MSIAKLKVTRQEGASVVVACVPLNDSGLPFHMIDEWVSSCLRSSDTIALVIVGNGTYSEVLQQYVALLPNECGPVFFFGEGELDKVVQVNDLVLLSGVDDALHSRIRRLEDINTRLREEYYSTTVEGQPLPNVQNFISVKVVKGDKTGHFCRPKVSDS